MEISKEKMTEYLEKFQTYQRMLQGMGDVHVDYVSMDGKVTSVTMWIFPNGKDGKALRDEKNESVMASYKIGTWNTAQEADQVMKEANNYVKTLAALK